MIIQTNLEKGSDIMNIMDECVVCGTYVPEGRDICPTCENCGIWSKCKTFEETWTKGNKTCDNWVQINFNKVKQRITAIRKYSS